MDELAELQQLAKFRRNESLQGVPTPGFEGINFHPDSVYGENYIRGRSNVMSYEEARKFSQSRVAPDDFGVFWGGAYLPTLDATNFCIVGIPGSGKTTLIRLMMQSVLPLIGLANKSKAHAQRTAPRYFAAKYGVPNPDDYKPKTESHRALIFDIKPEYLGYLNAMNLNCPVKVLDPYHINSYVWDAGKDIDDTKIRTFAKIFIPESQANEDKNSFFVDSTRDVISLVLTALNRSRPRNWTFCDFVDIMRNEEAFTELIRSYPDLKASLRQIQARMETFQNVIQQIRTFIAEVEPASTAWRKAKGKVSLKDWLDNEYIIVLSRKEEYRESVDPIYRVMFGIAASLGLSYKDSTTRRTWFFLDELGNAGELTNLAELMSMGRSKGVSVVIGAQGIPTLQRVFKTKEKVNEILELCAYTTILRVGDGGEEGTASWAERILGKSEFYESKTGFSLARAYTTGKTTTKTEGSSESRNDSQAIGKSHTKTLSSTTGNSTTDGSQNGNSYTHTSSSSMGNQPSTGLSDAYGTNKSWSSSQTHNTGITDGFSDADTTTDTTGNSTGTNRSTSDADTESETRTNSITINRDRLEKSLVLASQIASLKTLKYDGMLLGYFITPFSTYAMALPGEYVKRALQETKSQANFYETISLDSSTSHLIAPYEKDDEDLLEQRVAMSELVEIRDLNAE